MNYGKPFPLGATVYDNGVNFSIFSPFATHVELLLFKDENDAQPTVISFQPQFHKTYYYWHIFVEGISQGDLYAYRINGNRTPSNPFDFSKVLLDPYGKAVVGNYNRKECMEYGKSNLSHCLKNGVVAHTNFNWEGVEPPSFPHAENIIYELHPKGFTRNSDTANAGTFRALESKISYFKSLGINTIELMPVFLFDVQDAPEKHTNYWGYSPLSYFALHFPYCESSEPIEAINEFKSLIKKCHENNIKVIIDVVYNHTSESHETGPCYSFKGIANSSYYLINDKGEYLDFTGCGNTINTNHSVVRRMIIDSLLYWKNEFHIDGFRFDLAGVLTRGEEGNALQVPPIIWEIDSHPDLANTLLIAEPWDTMGHHSKSFPGDKWSIWQDFFRDTMRKTIRGDEGMIPHFISCFVGNYNEEHKGYFPYKPQRNIHFITCHDGFTLNDLVSYNEKHNQANGENNQDGSNHNLSFNYGIEGATTQEDIESIRLQQIKNFFLVLLFSHGTPMISMGDEFRRTQNGNNNPYSLDNEISWVDWGLWKQNKELFQFVQQCISIRKKFKIFSFNDYFHSTQEENVPYFKLHGTQLNEPDTSYFSRSIAIELLNPAAQEHIVFIGNFYFENLTFQLPKGKWKLLLSSSEFVEEIFEQSIQIKPRTTVILIPI